MAIRSAESRLLTSLLGWAANQNATQTRQYRVPVVNGNVNKAMRNLINHIKDEKLADKWKATKQYIKPSHQRVIQQKETQQRINKEKFKTMMYWVMQAKSRGF